MNHTGIVMKATLKGVGLHKYTSPYLSVNPDLCRDGATEQRPGLQGLV